ncbi:MAG: hypothetical protein IJJ40_06270 [Clostridia bacterium]|nr:hypothetical protein [Clostridia bacterium]
MANIKISPDKVLDLTKKINKYRKEYDTTYRKLIKIIENNEAKLDKTTQEALLASCNNMNQKYKTMTDFLKNTISVTESIATEYNKINGQAASKIAAIGE